MGTAEYQAFARMLRKVDFFAPLTVGQLDLVLPYILLFSCGPGETVFKQGAAGDAFYIVYAGKVEVRVKKGFLSFSKTVTTLGSGDFFGEMALLSNAPRTATVAATEPAKLFALLAADFDFIRKKNPSFSAEMDKVAERRKFLNARK